VEIFDGGKLVVGLVKAWRQLILSTDLAEEGWVTLDTYLWRHHLLVITHMYTHLHQCIFRQHRIPSHRRQWQRNVQMLRLPHSSNHRIQTVTNMYHSSKVSQLGSNFRCTIHNCAISMKYIQLFNVRWIFSETYIRLWYFEAAYFTQTVLFKFLFKYVNRVTLKNNGVLNANFLIYNFVICKYTHV